MIMMILKVQDERRRDWLEKNWFLVCGDMFDVDDPQIENASKPRNLACASCNIAFRDKYWSSEHRDISKILKYFLYS